MARRRTHALLAAKNDAWMALRRYESTGGERGSDEHRRLEAAFKQASERHAAAGAPKFAPSGAVCTVA